MPFRIGPWEIALILVIILIVFGVGKLPQVGGAIGKGIRAFKNTDIISYEQPWNLLIQKAQLFVTLEKRHIDKKIKAISCYQSQQERSYSDKEFLYGWAPLGTMVWVHD